MTEKEMLGGAEWIGTGDDRDMPIIRDSFTARKGEHAEITVIGFGVFILYVNGVRAHEEECLPLVSDFEPHPLMPKDEILEHRIYPEKIDISHLLRDGENVVAVWLGNGWYNMPIWEENNGDGRKKLCYRIKIDTGEGQREHLSSHKTARWVRSPVTFNHYNKGEDADYTVDFEAAMLPDFTGESFPTVEEVAPRDTQYLFTDCPRDYRTKHLEPRLISDRGGVKLYDFGINTTGYPYAVGTGKRGDEVRITFSEDLLPDGSDIDMTHAHDQRFNFIQDGTDRALRPVFGWICARYARVEGEGRIVDYEEMHAAVGVSSDFECSNEVLNYLYRTFIHTQLINMHTGIPSDCPQIERRGYTGDGQLICHAAMMMTDSEKFYRKWLYDISDCQDRRTGHVQYTAPYTLSGGGPGGWGSAIVTVPYEFYLRFGNSEPMAKMYGQMHRYIEYLDAHSSGGLVISDKEGLWCLGDWCTPESVILPAPFVNNYFYVKSCEKMIAIAKILGKTDDIPALEERIRERRQATANAYLNTWDGSFLGGSQGANAFALDMGIGDERTKKSFIERYDRLGYYDTGIFGTELVTRLLFEYGRGDVAVRLMSASEPHGYGRFMIEGRTTLPEYWGDTSRSLCHPMFGAPAAFLFDYVLGIRQTEGSVGYADVIINPRALDSVDAARGHLINASGGIIAVEYRGGDRLELTVTVPAETRARLCVGDFEAELHTGVNKFTL